MFACRHLIQSPDVRRYFQICDVESESHTSRWRNSEQTLSNRLMENILRECELKDTSWRSEVYLVSPHFLTIAPYLKPLHSSNLFNHQNVSMHTSISGENSKK